MNDPKAADSTDKVPLELIPPMAAAQMAWALHHGAVVKGRGKWNWREKDNQVGYMLMLGAMKRHLDAIISGEDIAPDSGVTHLGHIMAGAAICIDAYLAKSLVDDRPPNFFEERIREGEAQ